MLHKQDITITPAGFRYIDDTVETLPGNIALVTAPSRENALAQMFAVMAADAKLTRHLG